MSGITYGLTYDEAMAALKTGSRVRLPGWNDSSWMELRDGKPVMNLENRMTNCQPRASEKLSKHWIAKK